MATPLDPDPAHGGVDEELPVEEVASRLGLPVGMLVRRIEAGMLPGRRLEALDGTVQYRVSAVAMGPGGDRPQPMEGGVWPRAPLAPEHEGPSTQESAAAQRSATATAPPPPAPRVHQWTPPPAATDTPVAEAPVEAPRAAAVPAAEARPSQVVDAARGGATALDGIAWRLPRGGSEVATTVDQAGNPLARDDLGSMGIDARELVAALLERWERTYEQRIEAEYRLRYEGTLNEERSHYLRLERQVEELRAELMTLATAKEKDAVTARTALADRERDLAVLREQLQARLAAILERDRLIAERDHAISTRDRLLHDMRREIAQRDRELADLRNRTTNPSKPPRRRGGSLFGS